MARPPKHLLAALMCGNLLEYFDFFIFAHFSFILAPKFYPSISPVHDAIISGFFFAIGFLARPLGGYIFGRMADLHGRRKSLMFSVLGMAFPTLCIGLLPTYATVGITAPIALITCRIIQGMCMGGEFTNGGVLLIESYGWKKAGTVAGLYNSAAGMGSLLAIACVTIVTRPGMPEWAWRVPFITAACLGAVAYYLRSFVAESPIFKSEAQIDSGINLKLLSPQHRNFVYRAFCVGAVAGVFIWIPLSYTSFYMTKILGIPLHTAAKMTVLAVITHNIGTAIFGWLSDRVGLQRTILTSCLVQLLLVYPAFNLLHDQHFTIFQLLMVIPAAMAYSVVHPLSSYQVPVLIRGRLSGFAFSAGLSVFAGLTPMITGTLTQLMGGSLVGVVIYVAAVAIIGGVILTKLFKEEPSTQKGEFRMVA
jgi:MHS family proline/betaine transporter-like MFS transporter